MSTHTLKGLFLGVFLLVGACGGGSKPPPGSPCVKNSDCTNPLSCSYGLCHVTCTEARDCPTGQDCVKAATGNVCQLPVEAKCEYLSQCAPPLVCALDRQCRGQCLKDIDCPTPTQKCVLPDMVCAEPAEINQTTGLLKNALGTPVPAAPPDAGAGDGGVNTVIGTAGGTVSGDGATVVVPAGALAQDQTVSIQVAPAGYPALPTGAVLLSSVLALEPHGQLFTKPVTVSIGFTARSGATPELITAAPGGSWASVAGATVSGASMQAMVAHFSFFAVVGLSMDGGAGGTTGTGGAAGAAGGSTGTGGAAGTPCPLPQLTFGKIGHGDSNPNFTSGVGARTANAMYIFSGYTDTSTSPSTDLVYVQAFDPVTGISKGSAQPLFTLSSQVWYDPGLQSAAVAPTGQIALLYSTRAGEYTSLSVAFLDSAGATGATSDGGAAGLVVNNIVQIDSSASGKPDDPNHVIWSNASQSFVVSWGTGANFQESVAKFTVAGTVTAGGVAILPTDVPNSATDEVYAEGSVGESGGLLGVDYQSSVTGDPSLTVLDTLGKQVGSTIAFAQLPVLAHYWSALSGTAQGFVGFYQNPGSLPDASVPAGSVTEVFVPTSNGAVVGNAGTFPTFTFPGSSTALWVRAVSDDVGTGGNGGVGVAIKNGATSVGFAYVHANGVDYDGPVSTGLVGEVDSMSLTNFNGSFVMTSTIQGGNPAVRSTQIVATGCQ